MSTLGNLWKGLSGSRWMSCFLGISWGYSVVFFSVFLVGINLLIPSTSIAQACVPNANHYSVTGSAAAAPWNSGNPATWISCPPDGYQDESGWTSDRAGNCCATSSVGMTESEFFVKSFQTSALTVLGMVFHGFFITLNFVIRRR